MSIKNIKNFEESKKDWVYVCVYNWFTLPYSRNKHNIVNTSIKKKNQELAWWFSG